MTMVERPLAGPGIPATALEVLEHAGWKAITDEMGNTYAFPASHRVIAAFLPERNSFRPNADPALWAVRTYNDLNQMIWEATFTDHTPTEFIAAFLADLVKSEPLDTERDKDEPKRTAEPTSCA